MLHVDPTLSALDAVPATPSPPDCPGMARLLVERQLALLTRLADRGMELAEEAANRALAALQNEAAGEAAGTGRDPSLVYEGAARAVRMTIALQARLLHDLPGLDKAEALARIDQRHGRRRRILHRVEAAVAAECEDDAQAIRRLSGQAWRRLQDADDYSDILTCPFDEAVARICTQLGLAPEAWAVAAPAAATPGDIDPAAADPPPPAHPHGSGDPGLSGRAGVTGEPRPPPWPG